MSAYNSKRPPGVCDTRMALDPMLSHTNGLDPSFAKSRNSNHVAELASCTLGPMPTQKFLDYFLPQEAPYDETHQLSSQYAFNSIPSSANDPVDIHIPLVKALNRRTKFKSRCPGYVFDIAATRSLLRTSQQRLAYPHCSGSFGSGRRRPDFTGSISWIPSYEGAKAFAELRHSSEPIVHLVHPRPSPWRIIIAPITELLNVPLVPAYRWLSALKGSALHAGSGPAIEMESMKQSPALGLISFYQARGGDKADEKEPMGHVHLSTGHSTRASTSLASMPELEGDRARLWVVAWQKSGFLALGL
ncbi:hypothetical protein C8Q74DRAFT_1305524 [Fomes fomentarius]|nr:hypothetical protein C8Q74DRAFT_1305524 [Fomes fomentarius]